MTPRVIRSFLRTYSLSYSRPQQMGALQPLVDLVRSAARSLASEAVFAVAAIDALGGPRRWTILSTSPAGSGHVYGLVLGRHLSVATGVVVMLALRADGTLRPVLLPVHGEILDFDECHVRVAFVLSDVRMIRPPGHDFVRSPVLAAPDLPDLCMICAQQPVVHEQERFQLLVERALNTTDVRVVFKGNTSEPETVYTRDPAPPVEPPRVVEQADGTFKTEAYTPPRREWRPLTQEEWHKVLRASDASRAATGEVNAVEAL